MRADTSRIASKKILIVVGSETPTEGRHIINGADFELRVICLVRAKEKGERRSKFDAVRYMRHGGGFSEWQKQERTDTIVTHSMAGDDLYHELEYALDDCYFGQCVSVYVRRDDVCVDSWRSQLFESMGGKSHVRCQCCQFPLIPSHRHKADKRKCNTRHYVSADGNQHQSEH